MTGPCAGSELARAFESCRATLRTVSSDYAMVPAGRRVARFVIAPILDADGLAGAVAGEVGDEEIRAIVGNYTGLGTSGETVVAARRDGRAVFQAPTRNDPAAAFRREIPIGSGRDPAVESAVQGGSGSGIVRDYLGRECLAMWRYNPDVRWGIVVKQETWDAFGPARHLRAIVLAVTVATAVVVGLLALVVARSFSNPLRDLDRLTATVAEGDLARKIEVRAKNEIGDLADSFNRMIGRLRASIEELRRTTAAKERIERDLQIARSIQMSLVPKTFPPFPGRKDFEIFGILEPAREVGGDFYDFFLIDDDKRAGRRGRRSALTAGRFRRILPSGSGPLRPRSREAPLPGRKQRLP